MTPDSPEISTLPVRKPGKGGSSVVQQLLNLPPEPVPPPSPPPAPAPAAPKPSVAPKPQPTPAVEKAAPPRPEIVEPPCPRCGAKLIDPESMALCPGCGWCRSLEEAAYLSASPSQAAKRASVLGSAEFLDLVLKSPTWLLILIGGIITLSCLSVVIGRLLPDQGAVRALWTTGQIGLGLLCILAAQAWSLILFAPQDDKLGAKDLFMAGRLWNLTLKRLPETQWQLDLAVWGFTLAVAAATLIGGLGYWLPAPK